LIINIESIHDARSEIHQVMTQLIVAFRNFANAPKNIEKSTAYLVTVWYCKILCSYCAAGICTAVCRRGHL